MRTHLLRHCIVFEGLTIGVILVLVGCSTVAPKKPVPTVDVGKINAMENELKDLRIDVDRMQAAIDMAMIKLDEAPSKKDMKRLNASIDQLTKNLQSDTTPAPIVKNSRQLPIKIVKPSIVPSRVDRDLESSPERFLKDLSEEEESSVTLGDSKHRGMHLYYRGLEALKKRNFAQCLTHFRRFLKDHPDHVYADRAEYQIGRAHFLNGEFGLVIAATRILESRYANSFRIPDALYHRALAFLGMSQKERAIDTLKDLLKRYPSDPVAESASRKVAELSILDKTKDPINVSTLSSQKK